MISYDENRKILLKSKDSFEDCYCFWLKQFYTRYAYRVTHRHIHSHDINKVEMLIDDIQSIKNNEELEQLLKILSKLGLKAPVENFRIHRYFMNFVKKSYPNLKFKEIDSNILREFFTKLSKKYAFDTIRTQRQNLLIFIKFIEKNTCVSFEIELNLKNIFTRQEPKAPSFLNEDEIKQVIDKLDSYADIKKIRILRESLKCKIILFTGLRINEVNTIKIDNIEERENYYIIKTIGKGNKERKVSIYKSQIDNLLLPYLKYRKTFNTNNPYLFATQNSNNPDKSKTAGFIKYLFHNLNIQKSKSSAHMLRHSFASYLYKETKDLLLVKDSLGHENIATTQIYTHIDNTRILNVSKVMNKLISKTAEVKCELANSVNYFLHLNIINPNKISCNYGYLNYALRE